MLNNISWASYVYAISIILVIYYIFVLLLFYRSEFKKYYSNLKVRKLFTSDSKPSSESLASEVISKSDEVISLEDVLKSFLLTIKKAASQNFIKEELLQSLKGQIQFYIGRATSLPKEKINQYIVETSQKYCSIHLNDEDLKVLWMN